MVSIVYFLSKASHGTFARLGSTSSTSSIWAVVASMTSRCQCDKTIMCLIMIKHVADHHHTATLRQINLPGIDAYHYQSLP